jgi:hypothetical protein
MLCDFSTKQQRGQKFIMLKTDGSRCKCILTVWEVNVLKDYTQIIMKALHHTEDAHCIMDSAALFYLGFLFIPRSDQHPIPISTCKVILHTGTGANTSRNLAAATNAW